MGKKLGFGLMRLPSLDPTDAGKIDIKQCCNMVDMFLERGFTYFDTAWMYCNFKSEDAVKDILMSRVARDRFTLTTKLHSGFISSKADRDKIFNAQREKTGAEFFDYYWLHDVNSHSVEVYDRLDCWKWIQDKKAAGDVRHIGFSFHDGPDLLDKVLTEHPEIEFVQIALNPIDWDSELVQARDCYDVIRRHGREVVIMEAVKGGGLAKLPDEAEAVLRAVHPDWSIASWSVRFCLEKEGVIAVLSGMSTLDQVLDNTRTSDEAQPLTTEEHQALAEAMRIYRESAPIRQSQIEQYRGLKYHGVPVTAILQAYSICQIQPNPGFSDDNNYLKNAFAEAEHVDFREGLERQQVIASDGTNITELVEKAVSWLTENTF